MLEGLLAKTALEITDRASGLSIVPWMVESYCNIIQRCEDILLKSGLTTS